MSFSRRRFLAAGAAATAAVALNRFPLKGENAGDTLLERRIPRTGESLPVIGLGGLSFMLALDHADAPRAREALRVFRESGGRVLDTAPGYGNSETFIGDALGRMGGDDGLFLATKFNALQVQAGRGVRTSGGRDSDRQEMQRQMDASLRLMGRRRLDLQQVWNLGDIQSNAAVSSDPAGYLDWHMEKVLEWKEAGLTRYVGITTSRFPQYDELERALGRFPVDFVQLDYSIDNTGAEERLIPAARDHGVAILVNRPFGSGTLFRSASSRGKVLPPWAADHGIDTWGKYFLKFILSHEAVTAVIPASGNPDNVRDNLGAGRGPIPDDSTRRRMLEYWNA